MGEATWFPNDSTRTMVRVVLEPARVLNGQSPWELSLSASRRGPLHFQWRKLGLEVKLLRSYRLMATIEPGWTVRGGRDS